MLPEYAKQKAVRAIERRFGQSIMPYAFKEKDGAFFCRDTETGSWIFFTFVRNRLKVLNERDGNG